MCCISNHKYMINLYVIQPMISKGQPLVNTVEQLDHLNSTQLHDNRWEHSKILNGCLKWCMIATTITVVAAMVLAALMATAVILLNPFSIAITVGLAGLALAFALIAIWIDHLCLTAIKAMASDFQKNPLIFPLLSSQEEMIPDDTEEGNAAFSSSSISASSNGMGASTIGPSSDTQTTQQNNFNSSDSARKLVDNSSSSSSQAILSEASTSNLTMPIVEISSSESCLSTNTAGELTSSSSGSQAILSEASTSNLTMPIVEISSSESCLSTNTAGELTSSSSGSELISVETHILNETSVLVFPVQPLETAVDSSSSNSSGMVSVMASPSNASKPLEFPVCFSTSSSIVSSPVSALSIGNSEFIPDANEALSLEKAPILFSSEQWEQLCNAHFSSTVLEILSSTLGTNISNWQTKVANEDSTCDVGLAFDEGIMNIVITRCDSDEPECLKIGRFEYQNGKQISKNGSSLTEWINGKLEELILDN